MERSEGLSGTESIEWSFMKKEAFFTAKGSLKVSNRKKCVGYSPNSRLMEALTKAVREVKTGLKLEYGIGWRFQFNLKAIMQ